MAALSIADHIHRLRRDERGAVNVLMGFLLIPLVGGLALGFEISNWYMVTRAMQNAADTAAVAAATNAASNYDVEAKAVAAQYGFVDGANTISVTTSNTATCPGGGNNCYSVTISGLVPLLMSQVVGFQGDATLNGALQKRLASTAVAKAGSTQQDLCMLALASSGAAQGIRTNGAPTGNLNGCSVMSNTAAVCNGSNLGAGYGLAHTTAKNCGATPLSNIPKVDDPYAYLAKSVPIPPLNSSGCNGNYPQETTKANKTSGGTSLSGTLNLSAGNNFMCGDQVLTSNVTINTPLGSPAVLIVENGQLDLNGYSLTTSSGSAVTIVFSGCNGTNCPAGSYIHAPTDNSNGGGNLDIAAPTTGPWSGVALYQDPSLTSGVDVYAAGNSPTWNITGLVYMPHASVTLKGAIDKATNGNKCVVMVADNFQISGTGGILKTDIGQCAQAGLTMPTATIPARPKLVL